jgi:hypothetical protein
LKNKDLFKIKLGKLEVVVEIYRPMIRSRHPSHAPLREVMERLPFRSVIRMGSTTELVDMFTRDGHVLN